MQIDRSRFKTEAAYSAALRDSKLIDDIKSQYDLNNKDDVSKVYRMLLAGKLKFESSLGDEFDDEIFEIYKSFENDSKSINNNKKNKVIKKEDNKSGIIPNKDKKENNKSKRISIDDFDESMKQKIQKEIKKREKRRKLILALCSLIAFLSIGYYLVYYYTGKTDDDSYKEIAKLKDSDSLKNDNGPITVTATINNETKELNVLPKYETLYKSNKKLIGWLKIDDTNIDYPVMQCDDNTYYLNHNFNQEESKAGALFLDYQCDVVGGSDNYIIYGHHLSSGGMFSHLSDFEKQSFYNKHKYIRFDTIYEEQTYQVMYVFRSRVYDSADVVFKYYQFIDANSAEEFTSYMNEMKAQSFYDTGVTAYYGDQLLTLSTCDYNEKNGRFVVVAKRVF